MRRTKPFGKNSLGMSVKWEFSPSHPRSFRGPTTNSLKEQINTLVKNEAQVLKEQPKNK